MSTSPLTSTLLAHVFIKNEKINLLKIIGVSVGFAGIVYLFSDDFLINENNIFSAFCILMGSLGYVIGGILTLKISKKKNENVTASILIWATIILLPICFILEKPWNYSPSVNSLISIIYLGLITTGLAWVLRFKVLKKNGIFFSGIDLVSGYLIGDINVTSPTGLPQFKELTGVNLAKNYWDELEKLK